MRNATLDIDLRIGARVRQLRAARSLTLDELAGRADVSRAMLSRVERGESSATAQLLNKICGGLGVTLSSLFAATERSQSPVSRRADQPIWRDPGAGYQRRGVSPPEMGSTVDVAEIELPPGARVAFENRAVSGTDQHVWLLDGTLEVTLGADLYVLGQGDCLVMRFDRPVSFHNPTERTVRYAVIISQGAIPP